MEMKFEYLLLILLMDEKQLVDNKMLYVRLTN